MVDLRYTTSEGSAFFNIMVDDLRQGLPGPRNILISPFGGSFNDYVTDRRGTYSPFDFGNRQNLALRGGVTRTLSKGVELTVDGSFRRKATQFGGFNPIPFLPAFAPLFHNETELIDDVGYATAECRSDVRLCPRENDRRHRRVQDNLPVGPGRIRGGPAQSHLQSRSDDQRGIRATHADVLEEHRFLVRRPRSGKFAPGARHLRSHRAGQPSGRRSAGLPLDTSETQHATHLGLEHRFNPVFAVFGRLAQNFRVPNIDERVGMVSIFSGQPTNFNLRTQRSHDAEGGFRIHAGPFDMQTSVYRMSLIDELHFSPITFANVNLDPDAPPWRGDHRFVQGDRGLSAEGNGQQHAGDVPQRTVCRQRGSGGCALDGIGRFLMGCLSEIFRGRRCDAFCRQALDGWRRGQSRPDAGAVIWRGRCAVCAGISIVLLGRQRAKPVQQAVFRLRPRPEGFGVQFFSIYPLPGRTIQFKLGARFG